MPKLSSQHHHWQLASLAHSTRHYCAHTHRPNLSHEPLSHHRSTNHSRIAVYRDAVAKLIILQHHHLRLASAAHSTRHYCAHTHRPNLSHSHCHHQSSTNHSRIAVYRDADAKLITCSTITALASAAHSTRHYCAHTHRPNLSIAIVIIR